MKTLKKCFICIITGAVFLLASETASAGGWEYGMTQQQRNQAILASARADLGLKFSGMQCKDWVRRVVLSASGANGLRRDLPSTALAPLVWVWNYSPFIVNRYVTPQQFLPGNIVQMLIRYKDGSYGPHTAIVESVTNAGIVWIEENYGTPNIVERRSVSFYVFSMQVPSNNYSVYEVN